MRNEHLLIVDDSILRSENTRSQKIEKNYRYTLTVSPIGERTYYVVWVLDHWSFKRLVCVCVCALCTNSRRRTTPLLVVHSSHIPFSLLYSLCFHAFHIVRQHVVRGRDTPTRTRSSVVRQIFACICVFFLLRVGIGWRRRRRFATLCHRT